jgi:hypothetical protein
MDWVKQNLTLVISGLIAVIGVGGASYYLYTRIAAEKEADEAHAQAKAAYDELCSKTPYPSDENVQEAKKQTKDLQAFMDRARKFFPPLSLPDTIGHTNFSTYLVKSIADMKHQAERASVILPTNFAFSFSAQMKLAQFDTTNLPSVLMQLEDVKVITDILYRAPVYELIAIQRSPISANDKPPYQSPEQSNDYISARNITTNDSVNAIIAPYQLTFKCTTAELAAILEGMSKASQGMVVKYVKTEPSESQEGDATGADASGAAARYGMNPQLAARYGLGGRGMRMPMYRQEGGAPSETQQQPTKKTGTILEEKKLKIVLGVDVIKLGKEK